MQARALCSASIRREFLCGYRCAHKAAFYFYRALELHKNPKHDVVGKRELMHAVCVAMGSVALKEDVDNVDGPEMWACILERSAKLLYMLSRIG